MASKLKLPVPPVDKKYAAEVMQRIHEKATAFDGQFDDLEAALGMYTMGHLFGWRLLVLIHNKRTLKKYEEILGIKVREVFAEDGPLTEKSQGLKFIDALGQFWKGVSGDVRVENRRTLT